MHTSDAENHKRLSPSALKSWPIPRIEQRYCARDAQLYAVGLGLASYAMHDKALAFFYEKNLQVLPTFALTLGYPGAWMSDPETGVDFTKLLHTEQRLRLYQPLPSQAHVRSITQVTHVIDKGVQKGALMIQERSIHLLDANGNITSNGLLATNAQVLYLRGNGGFSAHETSSDIEPERLPVMPAEEPVHTVEMPTRSDLALNYRLVSGDMNPLHADPHIAQKAGFEKPILHGLGTFGLASYAVLGTCCGYDAQRFAGIDARFTSVVYPGETLCIDMWPQETQVLFRVRVPARGVTALDNGVVHLHV